MNSLLITGARGQLGREIQRISTEYPQMSFDFTDIEELDISDARAVKEYLDAGSYQHIVNCAAYTAVDKAEDEKDAAMKLNGDAVGILAGESVRRDIQLVHISTDYVFSGENNRPYREDDPVNPRTVYGKSKLAGEDAVRHAGKGIIIRTSWLYSVFGHNFVKTIHRLSQEKDTLRVVFDQTGSPTNAKDLARCLLEMTSQDVRNGMRPKFGVYHYSNMGVCSWFEFANEIVRLAGTGCHVQAVGSGDYPTRAARPRYSVLDKQKLLADYDVSIPHWKDSLAGCMKELINQ